MTEVDRLRVVLDPTALAQHPGFVPFRAGVEILRLYTDESTGATAAVLRYAPGAEVPAHRHDGYEHIYVLSGAQSDERGSYPAGTLIVNPPGSSHHVRSGAGCMVLIVWQRPIEFLP